uniref:Uncharacterized protein n=1 Tax=Tanacetum cinerariifolium TaxID=118510 RepID=A0A6L2K1Q5_TANCI|nr:hypothetical protein [Tanacetum cinerariifolium]
MEHYMKNTENGRMILSSVQNGPLIWPTVTEEDGTTRTKTYAVFSVTKKLQADCDCKDTNIVLQGILLDVYANVNQRKVSKETWDRVKLLMQGMKFSLQEKECLAVLVFNPRDDLIVCINKAMAFLTIVSSSRQGKSYADTGYKGNATSSRGNNTNGQAKDLDAYDSDCDDVSNAQSVLMANLFSFSSVLSKKAQRIKPTLYDGSVISDKHVSMSVIDDEETLILEEVSRSKTSKKEKAIEAIKQKFSHKLINYIKLNQLSEDFRKRFVPEQELSVEQAFWFNMSNSSIESSVTSPVKVEAPRELAKVFEDQFDSIKKTCVRTKEQSDSLIAKLNLKSVENEDLKAQIKDKVFVITSLKNDLQKLKEKEIVDNVA